MSAAARDVRPTPAEIFADLTGIDADKCQRVLDALGVEYVDCPAAPPPAPDSATVIPFPAERRAGFIRKQMQAVARYDHDGAARYLDAVVRKHRATLERKGVARHLIEADVDALATTLAEKLGRRGNNTNMELQQ